MNDNSQQMTNEEIALNSRENNIDKENQNQNALVRTLYHADLDLPRENEKRCTTQIWICPRNQTRKFSGFGLQHIREPSCTAS